MYEAHVSQKDVQFLKVKPKHRGHEEWDFTELLIRVPRKASVSALEEKLKRKLSSRLPSVRFRTGKIAQSETVVHVYAGAYDTHRITIRPIPQRLKGSTSGEIASSTKADRDFPPVPRTGEWTDLLADAPLPMHRESTPRIAIIIDDLGYDLDLARSFTDLGFPVSLSVLPMAPFTKDIVKAAQENRCEVMLHLPMEPESYPDVDAGAGALFTHMSEKEIKSLLHEYLKRVPGARGVNNHMGSRFTESEHSMDALLNELKHQGLFYVDSRTTSKTVAMDVAKRLGVAAARRNVFLDNDLTQEAMAFQWQRLLAISRQAGKAIGIAHPHPETVAFLRQSLPLIKREAKMVYASEVVDKEGL